MNECTTTLMTSVILEALSSRDPEKAVALMDEHLGNVEDRLDLDRDTRKVVDLGKLFAPSRSSARS